jgi:tungstate transport system substrate-binding protein
MRLLLGCLAVAAAALALGCTSRGTPTLTIATTTSVGNSGLLDVVLSAYEAERGTRVQAHLTGSGRGLAMLARGDADLVISHAPDAEAIALRAHPGWWYRKIMFNDFVIVGPRSDPADVSRAATAEDAMRRIAQSGARFISRGDESGTHEREQQLWVAAGARPEGTRIVAAGAGMGTTLRVASEAGAYTLTDRATFAQHEGALALRVLFRGGPNLLNSYAVIIDSESARAAEARAFGEWLASGGGREVVGRFRVAGITGFEPWPADRPGDRPEALPR